MIYIDKASEELKLWQTILFPYSKKIIDDKKLIILNSDNKFVIDRVLKYLKNECETIVCLSNSVYEIKYLKDKLKERDIKIIDGKWLYKFLTVKILDYICLMKKEKLIDEEIAILSNNINDFIIELLEELSFSIRKITLISKDIFKVKKLEKNFFENKGLNIDVVNNYKSSIAKSDIILNFDFNEVELNKYTISKKSCVINFSNNVKIKNKSFSGIFVNFFDISIPEKYINFCAKLNNFNNSYLYESLIYKNTLPKNIFNEIKNDKVSITFLKGNNGLINKKEYANLIKNPK